MRLDPPFEPMSPSEARQIIDALAQGIDPETGEILPEDGLLQRPFVIRALFLASRALATIERKNDEAEARPGNTGKPWTKDEEQRLLAAFDQGTSIDRLAQAHGRSKGGITSRLVRLGRIDE